MANHTYQTVIDAVDAILNNEDQEVFTEPVIDRLVSFGYAPIVGDAFAIAFAIQKAYNHVINETNQTSIPSELKQIVTDMICGEFLKVKFLTGNLSLSGLDFSGIIQSISEGDTTVSFESEGSDETKIMNLVDWLIGGKGSDLLCYRKLRW